jgi:hypothetical protein
LTAAAAMESVPMLSEELRNLALWMRTRHKFRALRDLPCDAYGVELAIERLDELAEEAERLEVGTRLTSGAEIAEMVALEGARIRARAMKR